MDNEGGLTNFLFGNVDEDGRLESDVFDDSEKAQVNALAQMGMGGLLDDFDKEARENMLPEDYKLPPPSPLARDYSNISDEELEDFDSPGPSQTQSQSNSMPPPPTFNDRKQSDGGIILPSLILPSVVSSSSSKSESIENSQTVDREREPSTSEHSDKGDTSKKSNKKKKNKEYTEADRIFKTMKKEIRGKIDMATVKELFPHFVKKRPPRFLELFKHAPNNMDVPNPYRFLQNKKPPQELDFLGDIREKKEKATTFALPRSPKAEEVAEDDEKISLQEMAWCDEAEIAEEGQKEEKLKKTPQWRNGPAKLWFDMLNVPADGEGFHYGFRLKPEVQKEFDEMDDKEREKRIADDNKVTYDYNLWENLDQSVPLHSQIDWEEDIIWDPEDAHKKRSTGSRIDKERLAGWIPKEKSREQDQLQVVGNQSIFPIDNYDLIYGNWEKEIIWDSQNMEYLPVPKDFKVNPNDDKLILQIPEDPEPRAEFKVKEGGKNKRELFKRTKEVLRDVGIGQKNEDGKLIFLFYWWDDFYSGALHRYTKGIFLRQR